MGYKKGKGLGKLLQGRAEPVAASMQNGRRGLGLELKELQKAQVHFDPEEEVIEVQERLDWLPNYHDNLPLDKEVKEWQEKRQLGKRKETIDGETKFCNEMIVQSVINSKSVFDGLDKNEIRDARRRSNPFERIRSSIFLNRAAVKMANMDKACDFMFTQPRNVKPNDLLYFADVCAGPGGFSEYVLYRKKWRAKGFGFTLKKENDFKLHDFNAGPCETFHPFYGPKDNGDVYDPDNQIAFKELIMRQTNNEGVHFMMADGGFSIEGRENVQEILSKQLYLCQCLVALMIVRIGGHFVTKLFDLFTPFSAGLIYIMHRCFKHISIFKPNTSRPANSERYLICKEKLPFVEHITKYLFKTNEKLLKGNTNEDVLELVPIDNLMSETLFCGYLTTSNETLGHKQIVGLKKIAAYIQDKSLYEILQKKMREECLQYWYLPDEARKLPPRTDAETKARQLLSTFNWDMNLLEICSLKNATKLTQENVDATILGNRHDWHCMLCASGDNVSKVEDKKPTFYLGMGRSQVFRYVDGCWEQVPLLKIDLPRDTLVYAEIIAEIRGEMKNQTKTYGLHIFDAFVLGNEYIANKHLKDR